MGQQRFVATAAGSQKGHCRARWRSAPPQGEAPRIPCWSLLTAAATWRDPASGVAGTAALQASPEHRAHPRRRTPWPALPAARAGPHGLT